jgi:transglutaminase-like putative cysteine protease
MKIDALPGTFASLATGLSRPMSRDKSDTLLLLGACAAVLAPHAGHLPWWIAAACAMLLLWRGWITFRGNRMPRRWVLLPLAAAAMVAVYWSNKTLLGREAGVAMLVLLLTFKLLEMHARRDLFVVVFLGFFLILTNFFYSQGIGTALMMIGAVILMLTAQISFQYTGAIPPLRKRLALGGTMFLLAAPLTLVLFVLFPRIQGPLWGLPSDAHAGRTGLSDTMSPGNISRLALSAEVAFRARFLDPAPPQSKLYWRGPVLGDYDGRNWTPLRLRNLPPRQVRLKASGPQVRYQVTLEPSGQRSLFALDAPRTVPQLADNSARILPDLQLLTRQPITQRIRYDAVSQVDFTLQGDEAPDAMRDWLDLPPGYNPASMEFAARLRQQYGDNAQLVNAVLRHFREQKFSYTLEPPLLGKHAVDDFLFSTRAGFCEHYASAFVVLMRAADIPARVVTGYQGGEINSVDGFLTVRQSDAHAWAEVWLESRGWVRVDPTAAVAPDRVARNLGSVIPPTMLGGLVGMEAGDGALKAGLQKLRQNWEAANNAWNQWVLDYGPARQRGFMESLGLANADWQTLIALMVGLGTAVTALMLVPVLRNRQQADPVEQLYLRLCRQLAQRGCMRASHEGPRDFRLRLGTENAHISAAGRNAAVRFLELYEDLRYGPLSAPDRGAGKPPAAALLQLKTLLAQCR